MITRKKLWIAIGLGLGTLSVTTAYAGDGDPNTLTPIQNPPAFTFSGFGTVGAVETNTDLATYTTGLEKNGATKTADFGPDTKAGVQMDTKFNDQFSATVQVFSKQNAVGSYNPDIEWAFAKLKLGGGFDMRLGRIGAPVFMTSDFRNVGYTNVSVRTPVDIYSLVPIRHFDGGDILYHTDIADTAINAQFWGGRSSVLVGQNDQGDETIDLHNMLGINMTAEYGPLTLRFGRFGTHLGTEGSGLDGFNTLLTTLNQFSAAPGLGSLATMSSGLAIDGKFGSFTGIGATLDLDNWIVNGELTKRYTGSTYIPTIKAWYATIGYRISTFTPYYSYSTRSTESITSVTSPYVSPLLPPIVQGTVPVLVANVNALLIDSSEKTNAIGLRWDAGKNYDIKAEFQQINVPAGSTGVFTFPEAGGRFTTDTKVNVVSLVVDFVF